MKEYIFDNIKYIGKEPIMDHLPKGYLASEYVKEKGSWEVDYYSNNKPERKRAVDELNLWISKLLIEKVNRVNKN